MVTHQSKNQQNKHHSLAKGVVKPLERLHLDQGAAAFSFRRTATERSGNARVFVKQDGKQGGGR